MYIRHTMGQDQAKPMPWNPPGAPKVTRGQVFAKAKEIDHEVRRDGLERCWWERRPGGTWRTMGAATNYLALEWLKARD